ncbi:Sugar lactone lactonase YvrE [Amycolatopsis marina]|uniref:Sugar lactone lactonase YvrE n=1 Tax=Amycolatopsis marina TaxID=490629 RepID=A0A1I1C1U9_9PSEU|nr:SMP-30/gluconolactonase/LRE family protein [Amycolatopsis marina]SFB56307.1 Sugar lactone lactonase YvrE [Amycolatopsis marina]
METATSVLGEGYAFTECPRWHEGRLWFVDMHGQQVVALDEEGMAEVITSVPGRVGGIGWLPDGRLLVVQQDASKILRLDPGGLVEHADLSGTVSTMLNDMWVDASGRAWVGEMGFDPHTFLADPEVVTELTGERVDAPLDVPATSRVFMVEPDGTWRTAATDLIFTNGIVLDDRTRTLFVAETFGARLTIFDVEADGSLASRRELPLGFAPDGMSIDGEGRLWIADPMHMCARLIDLNGTEVDRVTTDQLCLACAVGGSTGRTLFLCTAPTTEEDQSLQLRAARIDSVALAGRSS